MQAVRRKSQSVRQIRRRKEVRKFLNAYGRYIAAGTCLAVVVVLVTMAAVKLSAMDKQETTKSPIYETQVSETESEPTTEAEAEQIPYPFNLMSHDWGGEELEGWEPYQIPAEYEKTGGYLPECMQQFTYIICQQNGIDYALALAIMEVESGYKWDAYCSEGSQGYMQVNVKWHEDRMNRLNVDNVENPYFNVMVAVDYLAELQGRFDTEAEVLTAYNYGVTGAYKHVWNKGLTETEYSKAVQQAKQRIEKQLGGEE